MPRSIGAKRTGSPRAGRLSLFRLRGFRGRGVSSRFAACLLAVARGVQFFLHLQPFVGCHGRIFAFWRRVINAFLRGMVCLIW